MTRKLKDTFAVLVIKPEALLFEEKIRSYLEKHYFYAITTTSVRLTPEKAAEVYARTYENPNWDPTAYLRHITSDENTVMVLEYIRQAKDAQPILKVLLGNKNPNEAKPSTLRHMLKDLIEPQYKTLTILDFHLNCVHAASDSVQAAKELIAYLGEEKARIFLTE